MEIPVPLIVCALASAFGVQGWILKEIIELKTKVAILTHTQDTMKRNNVPALLSILLFTAIAFLFSGCNTPGSASGGLLTQQVQQRTNTVAEPFESYVEQFNAATGATETNLVTLTNYVQKVETVTNYAPNPAILASVETVRTFTPLIPAPFNTATELALSASTVFLAWLARKRNGENKDQLEQLKAIIAGVESATRKDTGSTVKKEIEAKAAAAGVLPQLNDLVKQLT